MSVPDQLPEITFDDTQASTYVPTDSVKYAIPVMVPEWFTTRLWAEWGAAQSVDGPFYLVYDPITGQSRYASDWKTWANTNIPVPDTINGWRKTEPIRAYLITPDQACRLVTRLPGKKTNETAPILPAGVPVWIVQQRDDEVMHIEPGKFEYDPAPAE